MLVVAGVVEHHQDLLLRQDAAQQARSCVDRLGESLGWNSQTLEHVS